MLQLSPVAAAVEQVAQASNQSTLGDVTVGVNGSALRKTDRRAWSWPVMMRLMVFLPQMQPGRWKPAAIVKSIDTTYYIITSETQQLRPAMSDENLYSSDWAHTANDMGAAVVHPN